ncbi:putative plasmid replication protein [Streptococcus pneumoniae]|uniref:Rep family protein n=1 Tax=Streptococcus pneumoniae TaxID=1313 RepID=UPI0005E0068F|nr:Rep family protein [Streptococcus pneumoniae]CKI08296.1 putative plasmid replication protein [Streptococcus pneumoniae]HEU4300650.1 replication protein [Streptococcus pneumoniae]
MVKEKSRNFTFLLYPDGEGFPNDWEERLEKIGVPIAISPLHDQDKAKNRSFKKAHYHGIYIANNPVTAESVRNKLKAVLSSETEECKAVTRVQIIYEAVENVYLYLTHESKDARAKGKHVYDKKDIKHINNFDIERYITIDVETKNEVLKTLLQIIRAYSIPNVLDLHDFIEENGATYGIDMNLFLSTIESKSSILRLYFDGAYQRGKRGQAPKEFLESEE